MYVLLTLSQFKSVCLLLKCTDDIQVTQIISCINFVDRKSKVVTFENNRSGDTEIFQTSKFEICEW